MKIYNKYKIEHTDGTPLKGKKYFVLRLDSDDPIEAARVARAMRAYEGKLRNCDVGTADEQVRRYKLFCENHSGWDGQKRFGCLNCPLIDVDECEFFWAQMPYEEKGGAK